MTNKIIPGKSINVTTNIEYMFIGIKNPILLVIILKVYNKKNDTITLFIIFKIFFINSPNKKYFSI